MEQLIETYWFRSMQLDRFGCWKPSELMGAMQEMGGKHADIIGCGRDALLKKNAIWVLTRNELHVLKTPRVGDTIVAATFPGRPRRTLYPRYHTFSLEDGTLLAYGAGGWTLADLTTHRMVDLPEVAALMPDTSALTPPQGYPAAVTPLTGEGTTVSRELRYSDFDVNHHVNNTRCADWASDLLGPQVLEHRPITSFIANYTREILPGDPVTLTMRVQGDRFFMTCTRGEERLLDAGGELGRA